MTGIIPLSQRFIAGKSEHTVSAREFYSFLSITARFNDWITRRIKQYGFTENQDYIRVFPQTGKNSKGGRPGADYYLTLDMAKELAMVERNAKGRQARRYFIDCERELHAQKEQKQLPAPPTRARVLLEMEGGQVTKTTPIPDDALVATPEEIRALLAKHGQAVIDQKDLIAIHRAFGYLRVTLEGAADAWNRISANAGMDSLKI